ncbi:MAG: tyrosine-protein phosphatase [Clostridia bacterium]
MIDIHSHIIYCIDDGPDTIEKSKQMVIGASRVGVKTIIATPHFSEVLLEDSKIINNYNEVVKIGREYGINILLGYEVKINPFLPDSLEKNITLNKTRFILVELPYDNIPFYLSEILYKLQLMQITPVIAHPERNLALHKNFQLFLDLHKMGFLIQVDAGSIMGVYGRSAKKLAKKIIKSKDAHFIASDAHNPRGYSDFYKARKKVHRWVGEEYTDRLFCRNSKDILRIGE